MKSKFLPFLLFLCFVASGLNAQTFSRSDDNLLYDSTSIAQRAFKETLIRKHIKDHYNYNIFNVGVLNLTNPNPRYLIPVVFHVFHDGGAGNISDAQIDSQMAVINRAYASTNIQFAYAKTKPNGTFFSGINRYNLPSRINYATKGNAFSILDSIMYPGCSYLNIMICDTVHDGINLIAGTSTFPDPSYYYFHQSYEGIILSYWTVGSFGGGFNTHPYFNGGLTLVHEIGHYLDIYHPFTQYNRCTTFPYDSAAQYGEEDYCWDTPPCKDTLGFDSCGTINSCFDWYLRSSGTLFDANDPVHNYMMYKKDSCRNEFTQDQITRIVNRQHKVDPILIIWY